jgi:hypothetical protein
MRRFLRKRFAAASLLGGACPPTRSPFSSVNSNSVLHGLSPGRDTIARMELRNEQECFAGGVNA